MPLVLKLACRNLIQDRLRFAATVVGVVFSIVLVIVQLGLFLSFERMVTTMIDHAEADLWIVPFATKCFEDPSLLDVRDRTLALDVPGVVDAAPIMVGFAQWSVPGGGTTPVLLIGSNRPPGLAPWNLVDAKVDVLSTPRAVAVDQTYFGRLGVSAIGDTAEIREQKVEVGAITHGIRSFTTTPYLFTSLDQARTYTGTPSTRVSYLLVRVAPGSDVQAIRTQLLAKIPKIEVLTSGAFRSRSRSFWLFGTGAGAALFAGALLGVIVGTVIVAQTLYSSTKDHLNEFATLRAIGSSSIYIHKVIVFQALISAAVGFALAAAIGSIVVTLTGDTALPIVMTPALTSGLFGLTVLMCIVSAVCAIVQVTRVDPVRVFKT
jgi:putative ABC transport system permease protein